MSKNKKYEKRINDLEKSIEIGLLKINNQNDHVAELVKMNNNSIQNLVQNNKEHCENNTLHKCEEHRKDITAAHSKLRELEIAVAIKTDNNEFSKVEERVTALDNKVVGARAVTAVLVAVATGGVFLFEIILRFLGK